MTNISLPDNGEHRLVYYLAMEEHVAANLDRILDGTGEGDAFFLWQVGPTVIFGRNQVMEAEVNVDYCRKHNVNLFRRKSGGGCVYSDRGNIMLSFISKSTDVTETFDKYLLRLAGVLCALGLNAEKSGRNDILVDGRKVSGNAFFMLPHSSIVHGTLLFDSDFDELERAITPSEAKISSKGVSSVRQHVANVKPLLEASADPAVSRLADISLFKDYLRRSFCGESNVTLSEEDVAEIEKIEMTYLEPAFLSGRRHEFTLRREGKIDGVGEIAVELDMDKDVISACRVSGDFFFVKSGLDGLLTGALKGLPDESDAVARALAGLPLPEYVTGLTADALVELIFPAIDSGKDENR